MKPLAREYDPKVTPWEIRAEDFPRAGAMAEQAKFLLGYAMLAPSSHNTQPWKFAIGKDGSVDIYVDIAFAFLLTDTL